MSPRHVVHGNENPDFEVSPIKMRRKNQHYIPGHGHGPGSKARELREVCDNLPTQIKNSGNNRGRKKLFDSRAISNLKIKSTEW